MSRWYCGGLVVSGGAAGGSEVVTEVQALQAIAEQLGDLQVVLTLILVTYWLK